MRNDLKKVIDDISRYDLDDYTVVVFGAGNTSVLYQKCFEREGIRPAYYIDNNAAKQDTVFHGVPVISAEMLASLQPTFDKPVLVFVSSTDPRTSSQIKQQLAANKFLYTTVDEYVFKKRKNEILKVYDLLEDDRSKEIYEQVLYSRIRGTFVSEEIVDDNSYFCLLPFRELSTQEVFVDLGAYVGDTVEQYIVKKFGSFFCKIFAFEPDKHNFAAMTRRITRLKSEWGLSDGIIELVPAGVGSETEQKLLAADDNVAAASSRLGANFMRDATGAGEEVMIYALDDYFKDQRVSFIKADIESFELDMLRGAEAVVKRDKPLLAVCIYHNASDMYTIPLFIKEICGDYKLKIRHHTVMTSDTVLYAYVE